MQVQLTRQEGPFLFSISNNTGAVLHSDGNPNIGGSGQGFRPMELLLAGAGGCVSIDLVLILKKQRQIVDDIQVTVSGERDETPAKAFQSIKFHFALKGEIDEPKLNRAIGLALEKYCSVVQSLNKSIKINYTYNIS
ncbi:MAG: OsmC family protein [Flavobacteriales bacterium]|nr:OsmC family protein [Flavobacteriales bacterium]